MRVRISPPSQKIIMNKEGKKVDKIIKKVLGMHVMEAMLFVEEAGFILTKPVVDKGGYLDSFSILNKEGGEYKIHFLGFKTNDAR